MLGSFRVTVGDCLVDPAAWRLRKAQSLVKLLALAPGHRLLRDEVIDRLWPDLDPQAAANNLRVAASVARRVLAPVSLLRQGGMLALSPTAPPWTDVAAFEAAVAAARQAAASGAAWRALNLYVGDLLPEDADEDWVVGRREVLRRTYLRLLLEVAGWEEAQGELTQAITALERLVTHEPTHEDAHRSLMRLYAETGQCHQAMQPDERLQTVLRANPDVEPEAATRQLSAAIRAGQRAPARPGAVGNLPVRLTSFIGREAELAEVRRRLSATRLLTLTGSGGCGKSRLALEVARAVQGEYPDGAWLVELAALADPGLVPQAVARALGVREQPGRALTETLIAWLRDRRLLLVLDNCEHLVAACAVLADMLLCACPGLTVLATSREALAIEGELAWRVPPLALPAPVTDAPLSPAALAQVRDAEAAQLFIARAGATLPTFTVTPANAAAIVQVCRRLDGMPLAIELAAVRVTVLTVEQLAARLDDCFRLLTGGSRAALPRHQTLRAAIDWSYELLSHPERVLLCRLAVFAGGWTLAAAEAVGTGAGVERAEVLGLLVSLVAKSLVQVEEHAGEARYRLLETVRQYAWERLHELAEETAVRQRHAEWCLTLAEQVGPSLAAGNQQDGLACLDAEQENLRVALAWCIAQDAPVGLRLAAAIWRYWRLRGQLSEGRQWLEHLLERTARTAPGRAAALLGLGFLAWDAGDLAAAARAAEQSRRLFRAGGDRSAESQAMCLVGVVQAHLGGLLVAQQHLTAALALARRAGDEHRVGVTSYLLGGALTSAGDYARARAVLEAGVAALRTRGDAYNHLGALMCLGQLLSEVGEGTAAWTALEESRALSRAVGEGYGSLFAWARLGQLAYREGNDEQASRLLEAALAAAQAHGFLVVVPSILGWLGRVVWRRGDGGRAVDLLRESLRRSVVHDRRMTPEALEGLALVAAGQGQAVRAAHLLGAAEALRAAQHQPRSPADQPEADAMIRAGQAMVGELTFSAARAAGRAWALDRAMAEALGTDEPGARAGGAPATGTDPSPLTVREWEVAGLIADGLTNRQIAARLSISPRTVDRHVEHILAKLGLTARTQIAAWVARA